MSSASIEQTIETTKALISHLQQTLKYASVSGPVSTDKPINPLALASTAASLVKAQTTKLTLLALNKPFTPSAIVQILDTISTSPLPALVTAVQICEATKFGAFAQHELQNKSSRLLTVYENLIAEIPTTKEAQESSILASKARTSSESTDVNQKAALVGTGLIWEVCDEIIMFSEKGVSDTAGKKMSSYRALFNDALEEIDEWLEDGRNGDDLESQLDELDLEERGSDSGSMDSFSSKPNKDTIPIADWALDILNHVTLLYPPLNKRRIKKFPELTGKTPYDAIPSKHIARLDQILDAGKFWSEHIDLIAEALFENDTETAVARTDNLIKTTKEQIDTARKTWDDSEDEFSAWLDQWSKKMSEIQSKRKPAK